MKIKDILAKGQPTLSFEVFPPKEESNFASVEKAALEIAKLNPSFMSVTYGAGGGTSQYTVQIASDIQSTCQVPALSHLTCVSSTRERCTVSCARFRHTELRMSWHFAAIFRKTAR